MMTALLIIDIDALSDMTPWQHLAQSRDWGEFFSHIPDAPLRGTPTVALARWAADHGVKVVISSRWDERHRAASTEWLTKNGLPSRPLYMRRSAGIDPVTLAHRHAVTAAKRTPTAPVMCVHADETVATALRVRGVRALPADRITNDPAMWAHLMTYARPLSPKASTK